MVEPTSNRCQEGAAGRALPWALILPLLLPLVPASAQPLRLSLGGGTAIRFTTPPPVLWNEGRLPEIRFDANGNGETAGLKLKRTIDRVPGGYRIRLAMTNTRGAPVQLQSLTPVEVMGAGLQVANKDIRNWTVFRLARHKNDIPGPFRPAVLDDAARDAASDHSGGTQADDPSTTGPDAVRFHADPGFVVSAGEGKAESHVFMGFDGQTEHLSDVVMELDRDRKQLARLAAIAEFDGVVVPPGATRQTHDLYLQSGADRETLLASHVERTKQRYGSRRAARKNVFCTWYFYGPEIVADDLRKDLAEMRRRPILFDTFLIDYGWSDNFGDWNANTARFPDGLKAMADEIRAAGLSPGIWSAPFLVKPTSDAMRKYPGLPLKERSGKPVTFEMRDMGVFYVVDPTAPGAEAFLTETVKKLRGWGYDYLKFDFLRSMVLNANAVFHDRGVNRAQAYRKAMTILRAAAGEDTMIGVWGGLYEANAGIVDINRSGSDVRGHWDPILDYGHETRYPVRMRQTFARSFYDEKLWTSDQDALQLRRRTTPWRKARPHLAMGTFTEEEAFSLVVYRFLGGGVVQVSEKLDELPQDRYDLYKMAIPAWAPPARAFGRWDQYLPETFVTHFAGHKSLQSWSVVTLCNWNGAAPKKLGFRVASVPDLPKADRYAAFEFRTQRYLGVFRPEDTIAMDLDAHAARVIRLTPLRGDGTYLAGTDMNLSNGMEVESQTGAAVTLKPAVAKLGAAKVTMVEWRNGKDSVRVVEAK